MFRAFILTGEAWRCVAVAFAWYPRLRLGIIGIRDNFYVFSYLIKSIVL